MDQDQPSDYVVFQSELAKLQAFVDRVLAGRRGVRVLDAGCGTTLHLSFGERPHVVGVDISRVGLERNQSLDEKIVGDIQTYPLDPESYDVVLCWDVLEHLPKPGVALENLVRATRRGGLLVLAGPNVLSPKGMVTKFTPLAFHAWMYRRAANIFELRPFKTYMRLSAGPHQIAAWANRSSLALEQFSLYESPLQIGLRRRLGLTGRIWSGCRWVICRLTLGSIDPGHTDFIIVLRRTAAAEAHANTYS